MAAVVRAGQATLGFWLLSCTFVFQSAAVPGLTFFKSPNIAKPCSLYVIALRHPTDLMKMKYVGFFILLTSLLFVGCTDKYEQHYKTYNEFNKVNQRNKGWFPDFITVDAFELRNVSYLDSLCAFGVFSYSDNKFYDSVFSDPNATMIDFSKFEQKVNEHVKRIPNWFLKLDNISKSEYQAIQKKRFYIVRQLSRKKIYFVLSN